VASGAASSGVSGYVGGVRATSFRWQRSSGDADGVYADLVTVAGDWFDDLPAMGVGRYYRVVANTGAADVTSAAVRAVVAEYSALSSGMSFVCGLRANDAKAVCWGSQAPGVVMDAPANEVFATLASGWHGACGLRASNRTPVCWGDDTQGLITLRPAETPLSSISVGAGHACGIRQADNTLTCWGGNGQGQTDAPGGAFRLVSAGNLATCAIRQSDDKLLCWGWNASGQAPPGPSVESYTDVACGNSMTLAIRSTTQAVEFIGGFGDPPFAAVGSFKKVAALSEMCAVGLDDTLRCGGNCGGPNCVTVQLV